MLTVSNTSPLLNLAIIDHLSLPEKQFQTVYIPEAVLAELRVNENLNGSNHLKTALEKGWLKVQSVQNKAFVKLLRRELDQGESEAIALAIEKQADLILLDEKEGRRIARTLNLRITGILGIAIKAFQNGDLESMSEFIQKLRTQAHFHVSPSLEQQILAQIK
jgi:predicted nucleic acid-binding protein